MHQDTVEISLEPIASSRLIDKDRPLQIPNWRPSSLKLPFFVAAIMVTLLHSILCAALIFLKYTNSSLLGFSASSVGSYMFWQFVPMILAVVPGLLWEIVYINVCRLQPYQDLSRPQGSTLMDSLSQSYVTSFSWFVPYKAWKHPNKHTALALVSIVYLLSYGVLPTATAAMVKIQWDDATDPTEATARPLIYLVVLALAVSISTAAFAAAAYLTLHRKKSGLHEDPASIAGLGALVAESNLVDKFRSIRSFAIQADIDGALGAYQVCLEHGPGSYQISLLDPSQHVPTIPFRKLNRDSNEAHPWWLRGKTYIALTVLQIIPLTAIIAAAITGGSMDAFIIRVSYTFVTVSSAAIYANWHMSVALLEPFHMLTERRENVVTGSSDAIYLDFTASAIGNLIKKWRSSDLWFMSVCAFMTQLTVIINPAVLPNMAFNLALAMKKLQPYYYSSDVTVPAGVKAMTPIFYGFNGVYGFSGLAALLIVMLHKRKPFLPRKPYTLSSVLLYLCHSEELLNDLKGTAKLSNKAREHRLIHEKRRYGLGWIEDENKEFSRVGINRAGRISSPFKYPKSTIPEFRPPPHTNGGRANHPDGSPKKVK